MPASFVIL